eukprot:TRINITY_DN4342_c0_g2_i3.p1 TRINITY_DN4342_c0_g2~~TRINITY_DN4342_c0_g2_i3.p1  ORF type:complete len:280 (+),score=36.90 TRINITY_DN4342_c0_g2_i3:278-1117(+)
MMGLNISGGSQSGIMNSDVSENGDTGVALFGGDRVNLVPSRHFAANCTLHHNSRWIMNYAPSVFMGGVGQTVDGCEIYAGPQIGVFMQGNDHTLSHSQLHHLGQQCSDCGAFYAGREWTYRGNLISNTIFSSLDSIWGSPPSAVYLDDQLSSVAVDRCTFDHVAGFLMELGGGRNNRFTRNQVLGNASMHFDARGGLGSKCVPGIVSNFLSRVPYQSGAWLKYPDLSNILDDDPCTPKYNVISDNVLCQGASEFSGLDRSQIESWGSTMENNTAHATCS